MKVIALDPGATETAFVEVEDGIILDKNKQSNDWVLGYLLAARLIGGQQLVIEKVASYGMPVGAEVFETVFWSGRFAEAYGFNRVHRLTRKEVANHLCSGGEREKGKNPNDATVRRALIDRYGGDLAIRKGGPLYGVSKDIWSALAVACAYLDGVR